MKTPVLYTHMNNKVLGLINMNDSETSRNLSDSFSLQRDDFLSRSHETYEERKAHLTNLKKLLTVYL